MRITLQRTGGMLPRQQAVQVAVDTATLGPDDAQRVEALARQALAAGAPSATSGRPIPDGFSYEVTIDDGNSATTLVADDVAMPNELRELVSWLRGRPRP